MYARARKIQEAKMVIFQNNNSVIKANKTNPNGVSIFLFILKVYHFEAKLQELVNHVMNFYFTGESIWAWAKSSLPFNSIDS